MTFQLGRIFALAFMGAGACFAGLVDIAFYNSGYGGTQPTGAAVLGQAGDQWNWIDAANCPTCPANTSLIDTNGNAISAVLNFTADGAVPSATVGTSPDPNLMNNYLFNNTSGEVTVTLSGLLPNQAYNLVLYVASFDASGGERALAGTAGSVPFAATGDAQSSFVNGANVVELSVTSDGSGNLAIVEGDGLANSTDEVDLNGLQLASVPEPGTIGMIVLGAGLVVWGGSAGALTVPDSDDGIAAVVFGLIFRLFVPPG